MFELDTILWIEGWETKTRNESHHILKFEGELFQLSFGFFFFLRVACVPPWPQIESQFVISHGRGYCVVLWSEQISALSGKSNLLLPPFQPIRFKMKTSRDWVTRVFPRFK